MSVKKTTGKNEGNHSEKETGKAAGENQAAAKAAEGMPPPSVPGRVFGIDSSGTIIEEKDPGAATRRPPDNDLPGTTVLLSVLNLLEEAKLMLDSYAQHLRPLDRRRLNGVGMKKFGFIETAYDISKGNSEFLPHYLTMEKFTVDKNRFDNLTLVNSTAKQVEELLWNVTMQSSDILYTDALEFYSSAREGAKRRVDAAEAIFNKLAVFFKKTNRTGEEPTEKELKRDFNATLHGKRDGEVAVRNIKPKVSAGVHEVVDKKFSDSEQFKETIEGGVKE
jgi:hypothetical protein